nr:RNA-directed DNA polymerase, eukaryota [Tanacetum cinerariifolium]
FLVSSLFGLGLLLGSNILVAFDLAFHFQHALLTGAASGIAFVIGVWRLLQLLFSAKMGFFTLTFLLATESTFTHISALSVTKLVTQNKISPNTLADATGFSVSTPTLYLILSCLTVAPKAYGFGRHMVLPVSLHGLTRRATLASCIFRATDSFSISVLFYLCRSPMGAHNKNSLQSKADQTVRISKSVFVSSFPDGCTAKDLWKVCNDYGTVVDVFIPNKKSKVGKRFAFVRFIKAINLDRLIENLNTIWIGRFYLFANSVCFERPKKPNLSPHNNAAAASSYLRGVDQAKGQFQTGSYVHVVNGSFPMGVNGPSISSTSVLVLDDSCVVERDLSNHIMGKVKDVCSISNLRTLNLEEGFSVVNLMCLGGEALDIEDNVDSSFGCKRLCIKIKLPLSILESFKVIFKGKVYMVRAKELLTWSPIFLGQKEMEYTSVEDSDVGPQKVTDRSQFCEEGPNNDRVSDVEEVLETNFRDNSSIFINHIDELEKQQSEDPFNIYRLLRKQPGDAKEIPAVVNAKVMNNSQDVYKEASCDHVDSNVVKKGGSVLGVIEDMIQMNILSLNIQGLGHKTKNEWIKELTSKNKINFMEIQERKTHYVNHMDVKLMWGNSNYNYVYSEAVGNSGGILCVWEATVFKKDYATISDNFIAIYETWLTSNSKVLFVAIYAPQQVSRKRLLWDYVSTLIDCWNGEVVVLGDFNEVQNIDERRGSCFNPTSARVFDQFISASGIVNVKMEGYTFTWSHPSGSKMSKLDRFRVSEGIFSIFPSITAVCLDRHISDHRPIIVCEVQADFGPIPFRFYHSWIILEGFDAMVEQTWRSFSHNDANRMIRFKKKIQDLKLAIRGVFVDGIWCTNPNKVKEAFFKHFEARFKKPVNHRLKINFLFSKRLCDVQASDLGRRVSRDEIRLAV